MSSLDTIIPPEIRGDSLYDLLYRICREEQLHHVLEIGSSSGKGSTEALIRGISENGGRPSLHCIEVSQARHRRLQERYAGIPWVYCHNCSSVPPVSFAPAHQVADFYSKVPTTLNRYPLETVLDWLRQDLEYLEKAGVQLNGIELIQQQYGISCFDLVLIDGSEFSGKAELETVYGAGIIVLDDINAFKNLENHHRLLLDPAYQCIACNTDLRNGFSVFRRVGFSMPVHFFTIVLNGMPFIRYHIEQFRHLPFRWHWHIVEGAARLAHDTAWSVAAGGRLPESYHRQGLSVDGTTEYLDQLAARFPEQISLYRKPPGELWDGKREMVNAPLAQINEPCLLWQVDADELWTRVQLAQGRQMFLDAPDRTAAYYWCHFFVGPALVVTSRNCYSQQGGQEWLRTWRFAPGDFWLTHEPPRLARRADGDTALDVARICPFTNDETEAKGLVFQHFAYTTLDQLRFKEQYYGYQGAVFHWLRLQKEQQFPRFLREYFPWVRDHTTIDRAEAQRIVQANIPDPVEGAEDDEGAIVIDGVFFQYYLTGIARVWTWLLTELAATPLARRFVILDRAGTAPKIEGYRYIPVPRHDEDSPADHQMLEEICCRLGATLFLSTWHSHPVATPSVLMIHDFLPEQLLGKNARQEARWREKESALRHASACISVSENSARELLRYYPELSGTALHVVHNGIPERFRRVSAYEIDRFLKHHGIDRPYYLFVGPRGWYKNFKDLLDAFSLLPNAGEYCVVATGGGELEPEFAAHPSARSVRIIPRLSDEALMAAYSGATALVYPSSHEGFGLPPVEAMACGCPVIVGDAPAVAEVVGDAARKVVPADSSGFAQALFEMQRPEAVNRWRERGLDRAALFTVRRQAQEFSTIIESLCHRFSKIRANNRSAQVADQVIPRVLASHDPAIANRFGIPMDDRRFFDAARGIVSVDEQRWQAAQAVEKYTWFDLCRSLKDDRSAEHVSRFDGYRSLPQHCGDVLEIGCGPFTQSRTVLKGRTLSSLTLLDPLAAAYLELEHCTYRDGQLYGCPVTILPVPAEELDPKPAFDLIICINVLEHVCNAGQVLERIISALRPGGLLLLGEFCHDNYSPDKEFNLAHPIMLKRGFLEQATAGLKREYFDGAGEAFYLVGRKEQHHETASRR